ncbi:hypothetical protein D3C85_653740 [compost metagenome]
MSLSASFSIAAFPTSPTIFSTIGAVAAPTTNPPIIPAIAPTGFVLVTADSITVKVNIAIGVRTALHAGAAALPSSLNAFIVGSVRTPYPGANLAETGGFDLLTPIAASRYGESSADVIFPSLFFVLLVRRVPMVSISPAVTEFVLSTPEAFSFDPGDNTKSLAIGSSLASWTPATPADMTAGAFVATQ